MNEAVFSIWDSDSNGMIDCIEFFTVMIVYADGRVEDKIRFLVELFDFNKRGYLEDVDLSFIAFNVISATVKMFQVESEMPAFPGSGGDLTYKAFNELVKVNFGVEPRLGIKELLAWASESAEIKEFFTFTEIVNQRVTSK